MWKKDNRPQLQGILYSFPANKPIIKKERKWKEEKGKRKEEKEEGKAPEELNWGNRAVTGREPPDKEDHPISHSGGVAHTRQRISFIYNQRKSK